MTFSSYTERAVTSPSRENCAAGGSIPHLSKTAREEKQPVQQKTETARVWLPSIALGICVNVSATVAIVLLNKHLYEVDKFRFMVFLSGLHFCFTFCTLSILAFLTKTGQQTKKRSTNVSRGVFLVAVGSLLSVVLMNLTLAYNSVGFYQISKIACVPTTVGIQSYAFKSRFSRPVLLSLIPILLGVSMATVTDIRLNPAGSAVAVAAVLSTVMAQIWTNQTQQMYEMDSKSLLLQSSPFTAVGMFVLSFLVGDLTAFLDYTATSHLSLVVVTKVLVTCLLAVAVNITNYFIIGRLSPLTYQVIGHFKTVLILILGFQPPLVIFNLIGAMLALIGVITYSEVKRREQANAMSASTRKLN